MRYVIRIVTVLALAAVVGTILIVMLPRSFSADLSRIGKGRPAAVLLYDPSLVISTEMTQSLNAAREDFEPNVLFLVADVNVPQGRNFAEAQRADPGTLLLFDADGRRLAHYVGNGAKAEVRAFLRKHYTERTSRLVRDPR